MDNSSSEGLSDNYKDSLSRKEISPTNITPEMADISIEPEYEDGGFDSEGVQLDHSKMYVVSHNIIESEEDLITVKTKYEQFKKYTLEKIFKDIPIKKKKNPCK